VSIHPIANKGEVAIDFPRNSIAAALVVILPSKPVLRAKVS